jgi:hypothetical protein
MAAGFPAGVDGSRALLGVRWNDHPAANNGDD